MAHREHITSFDKSHYDTLINYLLGVDHGINNDPGALGQTSDLRLDSTLNTRLKPGSSKWDIVQAFTTAAGSFGDSGHQRYVAIEKDVRTFATALKGAEDVFEDTNDLTTYDASKFTQNYPDVGGSHT
jgi:hypothetical protein